MHTIGPIKKLGTIWWFEFFDLLEVDPLVLEQSLLDIITQFENNYSRFKSDSLIGRLNNGESVADPSAELLDLLSVARNAYKQTDGVFNIAIANQLESVGYDPQYSFQSRESADGVPNLEDVLEVSESNVYLQSRTKIDLGGFAKGYLIDKLATYIQVEWHIQYFLINGGGDMYVTSDNGNPVMIGLADPQNPELQVGSLQLQNQGFAASSPYIRSWTDQDGAPHNHLVGNDNPTSTYVTAPTATQADIWATTLALQQDIVVPKDVQVKIV